jgi:2-succinyl-5-enolpyruvyl-6-hydroxy-3-cyclohexene-1-carboxylate synthase
MTDASSADRQYAGVRRLWRILAGLGVRHVAAAPGSRSGPAVLAAEETADLSLWMHVDERSAAFFALGIAKATGTPAAVLTTSGSAAANLLPAAVEATYGRTPLLLVTADRPPELHDRGANQTLRQAGLLSGAVRATEDLPVPDLAAPGVADHLAAAALRAMAACLGPPAGAVHLNLPLREPLLPSAGDAADTDARPPRLLRGRHAPEAADLQQMAATLAAARCGWIVCGPQADPDLPAALLALADALGFALLADPLSGLRGHPGAGGRVVDAYDALLMTPPHTLPAPTAVLRFGAVPTSAALARYLDRAAPPLDLLVDGGRGLRQPTSLPTAVWHADEVLVARGLARLAARLPAEDRGAAAWRAASQRLRAALERASRRVEPSFPGAVFPRLAALLPEGSTLMVGNSLPVRELDRHFGTVDRAVAILGQRGLSGIDGVLSTAAGIAAVRPPCLLVVGDLSLQHDLGGFFGAARYGAGLTVLVVNNDGGGIFETLPQSSLDRDRFERLFATPHGLDFSDLARRHGAVYRVVQDVDAVTEAVRDAIGAGRLTLLEWPVERRAAARSAQRVVAEAFASLNGLGEDPA